MLGMDELPEKPKKTQLLDMLDEMIKSYDRLPQHALISPISHYDLLSALLLISEILKSDD